VDHGAYLVPSAAGLGSLLWLRDGMIFCAPGGSLIGKGLINAAPSA